MLVGSAVVGILTFLFQAEVIGPKVWMIGIGLGLYLAYVPYGCMLFDRMIAALGVVATAGFMIYVTDAFGYVRNMAFCSIKTSFSATLLSWIFRFVFLLDLDHLHSVLRLIFGLLFEKKSGD